MYNGHVSSEQLEQLSRQPEESPEIPGELRSHVENCPQCRTGLDKYRAINAKLDKFSAGGTQPTPTMNCPDDRIWLDVAAGTLSLEESFRHVQHASTCDACGKHLKSATRIFARELSQEEESILNALPSSHSRQQELLSEQISRVADPVAPPTPTILPKSTTRMRLWRPASYASSVLALIGISLFFFFRWWDSPSYVEHLLAQAYTENRTLEMRIPYATHGEFRQRRSANDESVLRSSDSFRIVAQRIASGVRKFPNDPKWLLLQARFDLLDWRYKAALGSLDKIDTSPDSVDALTTRALALYEQAEMEHQPQHLGEAIDMFGEILKAEPNNTIALFNQALACEKLYAYECATLDWQRLLTIEQDLGWSTEARQHLKEIGEKKTLGH